MPVLTPLQEGTHHKLLAQEKKSKFCKQGGNLDYSRYSQVNLLTLAIINITGKLIFIRNGDC